MQDNDGNDNSEYTQADDEQEIYLYTREFALCYIVSMFITLRYYITSRYINITNCQDWLQ